MNEQKVHTNWICSHDSHTAYRQGFDDGFDGYTKANPYRDDDLDATGKVYLWIEYEKGYREGIAERERVGDG